jgi:hypothetical protein
MTRASRFAKESEGRKVFGAANGTETQASSSTYGSLFKEFANEMVNPTPVSSQESDSIFRKGVNWAYNQSAELNNELMSDLDNGQYLAVAGDIGKPFVEALIADTVVGFAAPFARPFIGGLAASLGVAPLAMDYGMDAVTGASAGLVRNVATFFGRETEGVFKQTGSGSFFKSADDAYDAIRGSTVDIEKISSNTGFKPSNIEKVKNHLFYNEHSLDRYVDYGVPAELKRFDSDLSIANAWNRLETGNFMKEDIQLLKHETAEAWYMRRNGSGYTAAHDAADARYPAPNFNITDIYINSYRR